MLDQCSAFLKNRHPINQHAVTSPEAIFQNNMQLSARATKGFVLHYSQHLLTLMWTTSGDTL